jgi:ribulose-bisphosphate carboxylase small chain
MSFVINRPESEPGFERVRAEGPGRIVHYTIRSHSTSAYPAQL